jgi:hypothetical protein
MKGVEMIIAAVLLIGTFAALQERIVEFIRQATSDIGTAVAGPGSVWPVGTWLKQRLTEKGFNVILGFGIAWFLNASLLDLFRHTGQGDARELRFLAEFGNGRADLGTDLLGCILLGAAGALGSQFWHDLVYGLRDARNLAKDAPVTAKEQMLEALRRVEQDGGLR